MLQTVCCYHVEWVYSEWKYMKHCRYRNHRWFLLLLQTRTHVCLRTYIRLYHLHESVSVFFKLELRNSIENVVCSWLYSNNNRPDHPGLVHWLIVRICRTAEKNAKCAYMSPIDSECQRLSAYTPKQFIVEYHFQSWQIHINVQIYVAMPLDGNERERIYAKTNRTYNTYIYIYITEYERCVSEV